METEAKMAQAEAAGVIPRENDLAGHQSTEVTAAAQRVLEEARSGSQPPKQPEAPTTAEATPNPDNQSAPAQAVEKAARASQFGAQPNGERRSADEIHADLRRDYIAQAEKGDFTITPDRADIISDRVQSLYQQLGWLKRPAYAPEGSNQRRVNEERAGQIPALQAERDRLAAMLPAQPEQKSSASSAAETAIDQPTAGPAAAIIRRAEPIARMATGRQERPVAVEAPPVPDRAPMVIEIPNGPKVTIPADYPHPERFMQQIQQWMEAASRPGYGPNQVRQQREPGSAQSVGASATQAPEAAAVYSVNRPEGNQPVPNLIRTVPRGDRGGLLAKLAPLWNRLRGIRPQAAGQLETKYGASAQELAKRDREASERAVKAANQRLTILKKWAQDLLVGMPDVQTAIEQSAGRIDKLEVAKSSLEALLTELKEFKGALSQVRAALAETQAEQQRKAAETTAFEQQARTLVNEIADIAARFPQLNTQDVQTLTARLEGLIGGIISEAEETGQTVTGPSQAEQTGQAPAGDGQADGEGGRPSIELSAGPGDEQPPAASSQTVVVGAADAPAVALPPADGIRVTAASGPTPLVNA